METGIITGVLAISLAFMNPSGTNYVQTTSYEAAAMWDYTVKPGDSLTSIAQSVYGSSDYWTTIWNDNKFIDSPGLIEKSTTLKIRTTIPTEVEDLDSDLATKSGGRKITQTLKPSPNVIVQTPLVQQATGDNPLTEAQITYLGQCEAGMDPAKNTGNGYFGAFQFSYGTWKSMGTSYERADQAPIEVQKDAVQRLLKRSSIFTQFPGCARKMQALGVL